MLSKSRFYNKNYFPKNDGYFPQLTSDSVFNKAVREGCFNSQAPEPMVCLTALGYAALSLQGLADVKLPTGSCRPLSLLGLTIADSGERKSTVDNQFNKGAKAFEDKEGGKYLKEEGKYNLKKELHRDRAALIKKSKLNGVTTKSNVPFAGQSSPTSIVKVKEVLSVAGVTNGLYGDQLAISEASIFALLHSIGKCSQTEISSANSIAPSIFAATLAARS